MSVRELATAAAAVGCDGAALTDHAPGTDFAAAEVTFAEHGVALVPGREVSCDLGHVLVFDTDREWLAALPPRIDDLMVLREHGAALVWAHPAGWRVGGAMVPPDPSRGAGALHGVEVLNGERLHQDGGVRVAAELAQRFGLASCGGSDAHAPGAVGRCLTEAPGAADPLSFIASLVAGRVRPVLSRRWGDANGAEYRRADLLEYVG